MRASATKDLFYIIWCVLSKCATTNTVYEDLDRFDEYRLELTPLYIRGGLNDIIVISVPELDTYTLYYITNPDGDTTPLTITPKAKTTESIDRIEELETKYRIQNVQVDNSLSTCNGTEGTDNEITIGPLSESDHGNWVLSAYVRVDGGWMELYQVIAVEITEHVPTKPTQPKLNPGDTFELSLAYPIDHLESCEIEAPRSTVDRAYDRSRSNLDSCGFRVSNITKADEGVWKITGVGRIVYESSVYLEVNDVF